MKTPPDPEETIRLRTNLLRQLGACDPSSLKISTLAAGAKDEGFTDADERRIGIECAHLADPEVGMIREEKSALGGAVKRFRLASKGRDWLAEAGF